jgi:putative colanic acid biosynthesis glycosyltransferase WcaI
LKFLLLNQTFYPDVASTAQHLADLAAGLAERGHKVTVIASQRAYDDPRVSFPKHETWRGVRILRIRSTGFGKSAKWRRVLDFGTFAVLCCLRAARLSRQDVVVALTSPPLISLVGLALARFWRSRFVYWVMDLNPDEAIAAGWLHARSLPAKLLEKVSRITLSHANQVFALDRFMAGRILGKSIPSERVFILPPWSHETEVRFDVEGRERFRRSHGLDGKFVVMYSGNHSPCHPLDTVIEAARRLADQDDIVLCFIGGGTEFRRIRRLFANDSDEQNPLTGNRASGSILCLPYQPLSELSASLSAADLHLVIHGNDFVGIVHPCKIYNILRLSTPLVYIGPDPSPISDILSELNGDLLSASIRHGDVDGLVRQIQEVRNRSARLARANHLPLATRFSKEEILPRLIAQLEFNK